MKALFFKTNTGSFINLAEFRAIYKDENGDTILERSDFDADLLEQPIEDIEQFLLKVQGAL
jgi:hypothetical protein